MTVLSTRVTFDHVRNTAAGFTAANPVLGYGVTGVETDTGRQKVGDGVTAWSSLTYADAAAIQRANHTGTQPISTVSGLQAALDSKAASADVTAAVSGLVNSAPAALDTLNELAAALGNDANFAATVTTALAAKAPLASPTFTGTVSGVTKGMVGLGNVDNTTDASKPVSTAQAAADAAVASAAAADATSKANAAQAAAIQRSNHTGTQAIATVNGLQAALDNKVELDGTGKIPSSQLPSYVDDVLEYANAAARPATGETGKIYVTLDNGKVFRWSGSAYIEISAAPGSTDVVPEGTTNLYHTTVRAAAAAPVQSVAGKTGVVTLAKGDVGLSNVDNTSDANKPISTATQTALDAKVTTGGSAVVSSATIGVGDSTGGALIVSSAGVVTHGTWSANAIAVNRGGTGATTAANALTNLGAAAASHTHAAGNITSGTIATARLGSGTADATTFLRGDQTYAAPPVTSVDGGTGAVTITKAEIYEFTRTSKPDSATGSNGIYSWTIPSGAKFVEFYTVAGGAGGGSGRRGATGTACGGGGGGGSGDVKTVRTSVSALDALALDVFVGTGGAGGAAVTTNDTNGNNGTSGDVSYVRYTSTAREIIKHDSFGFRGVGGTTTGGAGGGGGWTHFTPGQHQSGGAGGNGVTAAAGAPVVQGSQAASPSAGGGGGGISSSEATQAGGTSQAPYRADTLLSPTVGAAGGGNGGNGITGMAMFGQAGGGGAGGGSSVSSAGGNGGNGAFPGGGGGGGGASRNGFNSGAGGNGGAGVVRITVWY